MNITTAAVLVMLVIAVRRGIGPLVGDRRRQAVDRRMVIDQIQLEEKSGGRSGHFMR